jgi:protein TonB
MIDTVSPDQTSPLYVTLRRRSVEVFACMVAISLLLHVALSVFVLIPARNMVQGRQPLFVDLGSLPAPVPTPSSPPAEDDQLPPPAMPAAEPVPAAESDLPQTQQLRKTVDQTLQQAADKPEAVHQSSIGLGITSGYFGSFADGQNLKDEIREYYFALMRRINEVWWTHGMAGRSIRGATFVILVNHDGKLVGCDLMESTGNPQDDQLLVESLKLAEPLPPLPRSFVAPVFSAPIRFVPPLNLMSPGFMRSSVVPLR